MRIAFIDRNLNHEWRLVTSISRKINKRPLVALSTQLELSRFLKMRIMYHDA